MLPDRCTPSADRYISMSSRMPSQTLSLFPEVAETQKNGFMMLKYRNHTTFLHRSCGLVHCHYTCHFYPPVCMADNENMDVVEATDVEEVAVVLEEMDRLVDEETDVTNEEVAEIVA